MDIRTALRILGLDEIPDQEHLERAYANLVKKHRPERDPARFLEIREAFEVLQLELPRSEPVGSSPEREQEQQQLSLEQQERLRAALRDDGFGAFKKEWEQLRESLDDASAVRSHSLLGLSMAFFEADPPWRAARLRNLTLEVSGEDLQTVEYELVLLELFGRYATRRSEFLTGSELRKKIDRAIVGWGDPASRKEPTRIAALLSDLLEDTESLFRAFPQPGGEFEILALLDHICLEAPDLAGRSFSKRSDDLDRVTEPFIEACSREIARVPRGLCTQVEAHRENPATSCRPSVECRSFAVGDSQVNRVAQRSKDSHHPVAKTAVGR